MNYGTVILLSWATFLLVWGFTALNVKRDVKGADWKSAWARFAMLRIAVAVFVLFVALRIGTGTAHYSSLTRGFEQHLLFTPPSWLGWVAAALSALGVLFAVWARLHLGRNWSSHPTRKEDHELVTSGPYRWVRHPIYTGLLLAALGTACTGTIFGATVVVVAMIVFLRRIGREERIMLELFPNEYPAYQMRTKKLIPFIW